MSDFNIEIKSDGGRFWARATWPRKVPKVVFGRALGDHSATLPGSYATEEEARDAAETWLAAHGRELKGE